MSFKEFLVKEAILIAVYIFRNELAEIFVTLCKTTFQ